MLEPRHPRAHAGGRIGGVAPHAALGYAAPPQVGCPSQQTRVPTLLRPARHGRQGQRISAAWDGCRAVACVGLQSVRVPLPRKGHVRIGAHAVAHRAWVLPNPLVLIFGIHGPGEGVAGDGVHRQRAAKDGAIGGPDPPGIRRARLRSQPSARLSRHARPGHPVRGLVISMEPHRRHKNLPHRIPHYRGRRIAIGSIEWIVRPLDNLVGPVRNGCQVPGHAGIGRVVEAFIARPGQVHIHQRAFVRLRNSRHHHLRIHRAPGKTRKTLPQKLPALVRCRRDQAPRDSPVRRAQDPRAVVGIKRVVGVSRTGQDHPRPARLHRQCANADRSVHHAVQRPHSVCERREDHQRRVAHGCVLRLPHPAAGRSHVEMIAGRVRRVESQRRDSAGDQAVVSRNHRIRPHRLPCRGRLRLQHPPGGMRQNHQDEQAQRRS